MMNISVDLSMTHVEKLLKKCYLERPDLENKVLTSGELEAYITWLLEDFAPEHHIELTMKDMPDFVTNSTHTQLASQLLLKPDDRRTRNAISATYARQNEQQYIFEGNDISVNRMLRYMPPQWHQSSFFKVYYTLSGICPLRVADEVIDIHPGTVVIVAPDILCATPCCADDTVLLTLMLRSSTFDRVFWNQLNHDSLLSGFFRQALDHKKSAAYLHFETDSNTELRDIILRIYNEYYYPKRYSAQLLNTLMSEFFIYLLRGYEGTVRLPRTEGFYWKHEFSAILNYIQQNYTTATIEEVAEKFHYSRKQIGRIVLQYTGSSYAELTLRLRMEKACRLMRLKTLSMEEVALQSGYSTLASFHRAFSRTYGCTPGEYKNYKIDGITQTVPSS